MFVFLYLEALICLVFEFPTHFSILPSPLFFNYFGEVDSCSIPLLVVTPLLLLCCWILVDVIITFALTWLLLLLKHVIEVL